MSKPKPLPPVPSFWSTLKPQRIRALYASDLYAEIDESEWEARWRGASAVWSERSRRRALAARETAADECRWWRSIYYATLARLRGEMDTAAPGIDRLYGPAGSPGIDRANRAALNAEDPEHPSGIADRRSLAARLREGFAMLRGEMRD